MIFLNPLNVSGFNPCTVCVVDLHIKPAQTGGITWY